jgi:hypothetical protein
MPSWKSASTSWRPGWANTPRIHPGPLPLAAQVTEYQMGVRRCPACGKRTRAELPAGVPRRPFGARLTAVVELLSGRYWLSQREVRQLLRNLWQVRVSLGAVVRQEQAESAAVAPIVDEAEAAVQQAAMLWRNGSFGSDSEAGTRFAERLLTVVATCRPQGRLLLDLLGAAGEAVLQGSVAPSLLPARPE